MIASGAGAAIMVMKTRKGSISLSSTRMEAIATAAAASVRYCVRLTVLFMGSV